MIATERLQTERAFHDAQARRRAGTYSRSPAEWRFSDDDYLNHESWIRPAFEMLGDVAGRRVLDYGCGHGMAATVLARKGANVTGFDLSGAYLEEAKWRAAANEAAVTFLQADAHALPFESQSFDAVWGNAILHHLDLSIAAGEIFRVLRPGGIAVFCEPWGENPLLRWARRCVHYRGKEQTPDELPLTRRDVQVLRAIFNTIEIRGFQLLSMVRRIFGNYPLVRALEVCDDHLLRWMPGLQRWSRYVVLALRR